MNGSIYSHYRQRGAFTIMTAGVLAMSLLCLVLVVDSGRLYMEQRSLQRVADMAALEAVSRGGSCRDESAETFARSAAANNKLIQSQKDSFIVDCVNLTTNDQGIRVFDGINPASPTIRVMVEKTTPASLVLRAGCLFTSCESEVTLQASAVAGKEEPTAAFSVGSRLIRFDNDSVLGGVLGLVGLDLNDTSIASYNGLANVKITPEGLLKELGLPISTDLTVGGLNALLATKELKVIDILDAAVTVAGRSDLLAANLELLESLAVAAGIPSLELTIPLLTQADGTHGLFAEIIAPNTQSASAALSTQLSALGILEAVIGIATHEHALSVDKLNINLLGLVKVTTQVGVVEPPSIAIGAPTRRDVNGNIVQEGAKAYTAQVRTYIRVQTGELTAAVNNLISLLGINLIHIDLPIALDLVTGQGLLEENTCTPFAAQQASNTGRDHAEIFASGKVGGLCIGLPRDENQIFSKYESCDSYMEGTKYLDILGLLKLDRSGGQPLTLNLLDIPEEEVYLSLDDSELPADWSDMQGRTDFATVGTNSFNLGTLVDDLVSLLLNLLVGNSDVKVSKAQNKVIAKTIWDSVNPPACNDRQCRENKIKKIEELAQESESTAGLGGLLGGLLGLVGDLLSGVLGLLLGGDGCVTNSGLLGLAGTSDNQCVTLIAEQLPSDSHPTPANHLSLSILKSLLDDLGKKVLGPILTGLLGLHISEVDVHLQDLNCGHARLLQ